MRLLAVYNPVSGTALLRSSAVRIRAALERRAATVVWIETRSDTDEHLRTALRTAYDRILVIGGDGTVHRIAELLLESGNKTPLAILASGSGNIVAATLGIPLFPLGRALDFALTRRPEAIDVLRINKKRICLIGAGQGYDTLFVQGATRTMKKRIGMFAYAFSFLRTFLPYRAQRYTLVIDGVRHRITAKLVLALNMFSVIGVPIERAISAHDGWIDVFVLNPRTIWEAMGTGLAFLARRPRSGIPRLESFRGKHVSIRQQRGGHVQIDGEIYPDKHLDIEILPQALHVVHRKP